MIVNLRVTPEKCHRTTKWNAELIHLRLMKGIMFPSRRWWLWKEPVVLCDNLNVRQATSQQLCSTWAWGHHWVLGASLRLAPALTFTVLKRHVRKS